MDTRHLPDANKQPASTERRATARLEVISRLVGETDTGGSVTLVNISEGGALIASSRPARVGEVHEFRFVPEDNGTPPLVFAARVIHVLGISAADGRSYALGLEFVTSTARQQQAVADLIAAATSMKAE